MNLVAAALILVLAVPVGAVSFDFTGHWTGTFTSSYGRYVAPAMANFDATGPRAFRGAVTVRGTCLVKGVRKGERVRMRAKCASGDRARMRGRLDVGAQTIIGTFVTKLGKGTFALTKSPLNRVN